MTPFSAPLSAVRQSQWEAQLDMFRRLSSSALDSTERLVALNMRTSRASMEQAAGTVRQMLEASDPRDLLAVGSVAQGQWHQVFAYGRELLGIASGLRTTWSTLPPSLPALPVVAAPLRLIAPAPAADVPGTQDQAAEQAAEQAADQAAIATAEVVTITSEIGAAAADIGGAITETVVDAAPVAEAATPASEAAIEPAPVEPVQAAAPPAAETPSPLEAAFEQAIESALADDVPPVEHTPIAQALEELAPTPASALHPIASTVPLATGDKVELPVVNPVEHTPPPVAPTRAPRASRKK